MANATLTFRGPFEGVLSEAHPRNVGPAFASDCDNCLFRYGDVRKRPGMNEAPGGGTIPPDVRMARYVAGPTDYAIALAEDGAYLQRWTPDLQPGVWTKLFSDLPYGLIEEGSIGRYASDAYVPTRDAMMKYRNRLDNLILEAAGLAPFTESLHNPTMASGGSAVYLHGTCRFYVSRYNANTDVESNATQCFTSGDAETLTLTANHVTITITGLASKPVGNATHVRVYQSRENGLGYAGLIAQVPLDEENESTFTYNVGAIDTERNGGSTYAISADDTDYNYAPPTMNGVPPAAVAMVYHDSRMYYATADGRVWFSQSVNELQGNVEHVGDFSYRNLLPGDRPVGMIEYRDSVYVFGRNVIYRWSGTVNSLTNLDANLGVLSDEIESTDIFEPVEGTVGSVSAASIIEIDSPGGGMVYFCGPKDSYRFDGLNAVPIGERIRKEYQARLASVGRGGISAAHYSSLNLIVWCFKDNGCFAYDYATGRWSFWDSFYVLVETAASSLGPVITRSVHESDQAVPLIFRSDSYTGPDDMRCFLFDEDLVQDDSVNLAATWTGGMLDLGAPAVDKLVHSLLGYFEYQTDDSVEMYVRLNGDPAQQVPAVPRTWVQTFFRQVDAEQRIGAFVKTVQPVFELALLAPSVLTGYTIEAESVGR